MKIYPVLATVLILGACGYADGQATGDGPMADPKAVSEALARIRELKATTYHHFLRDVSQIFPRACVGQEWSGITKLLDKEMCPLVESWGQGRRRYYLARRQAISFENGHSLDAYIWLSADDTIPRELQAVSPRVLEADIVLAAKVNAPYKELISQRRFPRDSVLDVVLRSREVEREGSRWPAVKNIFVNYGKTIERWGSASGFDVVVEFAASLDEEIGGRRMLFFVRSGFDPVTVFSDEVPPLAAFTPSDSLGDVRGFGGNEWWHGNEEVIEANMKKYLKSHE